MTIRVVSGPPAAGKSTYVSEHAQPGDIVIDHDTLAVALGSPDAHDHPAAIARVAHAARGSAIKASKDSDADVWLIHTQPDATALAEYERLGAELITIDPGIDVVRARAQAERPAESVAAVEAWYRTASRTPAGDPTRVQHPDMETHMGAEQTPLVPQGTPAPAPAGTPAAAPAVPGAAAPAADRGFPEATPLSEMNAEQRAAYWQHYARKHEDTVKSFGLTPQQVNELQAEVEALRGDKLTADEKALKAAREDAAAAATAELMPKLLAADVKALASGVISGDQLKTFMSVVNPAAFTGADGQIDESKVMTALTGMFGAQTAQAPAQRWQNAGQYASPPPPGRPGEAGLAEAARRFGDANRNPQ